jgi:GT2 family glycosyltransferase
MNKKVAIILVNWNSFSLTADCINSLREMNFAGYDIIVTDNASADGSGRKLKENFSDIILLEAPTNLGFTGGNNIGMNYALANGYEYIFLLNNDTFVKEDLLQVLVDFMDANPDAGAVQPLIYFNHNRSLLWNGGSYFNPWLGYTYVPGYNKPLTAAAKQVKNVDWITGCAFFTRASVLKETGLFPENMFIYYEDVDLSFRIKKFGYRLYYHPGSCVYHIAGMSNRNKKKTSEGYVNPIVHYLNVRNLIWLLKQHISWMHAVTATLFNFFYIIALMAYFVARLRFTKLKTVLKAVKDGVNGKIIYN